MDSSSSPNIGGEAVEDIAVAEATNDRGLSLISCLELLCGEANSIPSKILFWNVKSRTYIDNFQVHKKSFPLHTSSLWLLKYSLLSSTTLTPLAQLVLVLPANTSTTST
jgi:hypothetical protein